MGHRPPALSASNVNEAAEANAEPSRAARRIAGALEGERGSFD
jgi:hypothetical protein